MSLFNEIGQQLSKHFNQPVIIKNYKQVFGGVINQTYQLETNLNTFFLKINDGCLKDMFEKEFEGLTLLHKTRTIKIPQPILFGNYENSIFLITAFIQKGNASKNFWQTFAHQLAALHKNSNNQFGLNTNNYIGSLQQQNNFCNTWSEFYATQRIMPLATLAFHQKKLLKQDLLLVEKLCSRFKEFFPEEKPALIHGDLWGGNYMSDETGAAVIFDPAVYYGNREIDIAMSLLFGGFNNSFYNFYDELFPFHSGWRDRIKLCQLYPLLVHLLLFGGHYHRAVVEILKAYA